MKKVLSTIIKILIVLCALVTPIYVKADQLNTGVYNFKCVAGGRYMNVYAGNDWDGVNVCVWDKDGSPEQSFRMEDRGGNRYVLFPQSSGGRVVDANRGNSYSNPLQAGNNIDIWQTNDAPAQEWYIDDRGNGKYTIELVAARGLVITCDNPWSNNGNCSLQAYNGSENQLWYLERADGGQVKPSVATPSPVQTQAPTPAPTEQSYDYKTGVYSVKYQGTNLRSGAGLNYDVVSIVNSGTQLTVTQVSGEWGKTEYDGTPCWIRLNGFADYIGEGVQSTSVPTPKPETKRTGYVANTGGIVLRVRAEANTSCEILGTIAEGTAITVKGDGTVNGFYKVEYNGRDAYCHGDYISFSKPVVNTISGSNIKSKYQNIVNSVGWQTKRSYGNWDYMCGCYCSAYAHSYTSGRIHSASEYWTSASDATTHWGRAGGASIHLGSDAEVISTVKSKLNEGKPCVVRVNSSYGGHYVLVISYTGSGNYTGDFLAIDPWDGSMKTLNNYTIHSSNKQVVVF